MIRYIFFTLIAICTFITHAGANVSVPPDVFNASIQETFIGEENQASAFATYYTLANEDKSGNYSIPESGVWDICIAGNLEIDTPTGEAKCEEFYDKVVKTNAGSELYEVCGKDKQKSGGKEFCVDFKKYSLQYQTAETLAKVYIRYTLDPDHYNLVRSDELSNFKDIIPDSDITCAGVAIETQLASLVVSNVTQALTKPKPHSIICKAVKNSENYYFEFQFKTLDVNLDYDAIHDVFNAVCDMRHGQLVDKTCLTELSGNANALRPEFCRWRLDVLLKPFGYVTFFNTLTKGCGLEGHKLAENELKNEISQKLDQRAFSGLQMSFGDGVIGLLGNYVKHKLTKIGLSNFGVSKFEDLRFRCDSGLKITSEEGTAYFTLPGGNKIPLKTDNVVRCYITVPESVCNDHKSCDRIIDFVFDDLTELTSSQKDKGTVGLECLANGGNFDGSKCYSLDRDACDKLNEEIHKQDSSLRGTFWNEEKGYCELPDSNAANVIDFVERWGANIVGISIAVVTFPVSGGTVSIVLGVTSLVAWGVGVAVDVWQSNTADEINEKANNCSRLTVKSERHNCAVEVLRNDILGRDFSNWSIDSQVRKAVNASVENLVDMIDPKLALDTISELCETEEGCRQAEDILDTIHAREGSSDASVTIKNFATYISYACFIAGFAYGHLPENTRASINNSVGNIDSVNKLSSKIGSVMSYTNIDSYVKQYEALNDVKDVINKTDKVLDFKWKFGRLLQTWRYGKNIYTFVKSNPNTVKGVALGVGGIVAGVGGIAVGEFVKRKFPAKPESNVVTSDVFPMDGSQETEKQSVLPDMSM